jgi:hypothetical protein
MIFVAVYQAGSMSDVSTSDAQNLVDQFEALVEDIDAIGIFIHNTTIALPMFIPGFGIGWGLFSAWSTGYAFASLATLEPAIAEVPALSVFLYPFGLMELTAYSLGISRSYIILTMLLRRLPVQRVAMPTIIEIGITISLLLVGGFVEIYMIEYLLENHSQIPSLNDGG